MKKSKNIIVFVRNKIGNRIKSDFLIEMKVYLIKNQIPE